MSVRNGSGDKGFSSISHSGQMPKNSVYFMALGDLDELRANLSYIGLKTNIDEIKSVIDEVNTQLGVISSRIGEVDAEGNAGSIQEYCDYIKKQVNGYSEKTATNGFYKNFETETSALINIARTVSRRAERTVVSLFNEVKDLDDNLLVYFNALSDLLFILAVFSDKKGG